MTSYNEFKHKYPQNTWIQSIKIAISLALFNTFAQKLLYLFCSMLSTCGNQLSLNFERVKEITLAALVMEDKY